MPKERSPRRALTLTLLTALLASCAPLLPTPSVEPARLPALPPQARQSLLTTPSACSPTCSAGLTRERACWQKSLTSGAPLASCASDTQIDYGMPGDKLPTR